MEPRHSLDLKMESVEGGLKELVLKWFIETQAPFILHNGNFPDWFQGFTTRKEAEDKLKDKTPGCFFIRLSDKAVGYILSYKGQDRCRHFVINYNQVGHFIISGDSHSHSSLTDLIEHYKVSPIEPFGEYLTSCFYETDTGELYDVMQFEAIENKRMSVAALRNLWDHKMEHRSDWGTNQPNETFPPPALPPKNNSRKVIGAKSVGRNSNIQHAVPPVPTRGKPLSLSLSQHSQAHTHTDQNKVERLASMGSLHRGEVDQMKSINSLREEAPLLLKNTDPNLHGGTESSPTAQGVMYSELTFLDGKSRSLPRLDNSMEVEYSNRYRCQQVTPSSSSPISPKMVTCHTYSLQDPRRNSLWTPTLDIPSDILHQLSLNPLYQHSSGLIENQDGPCVPPRAQAQVRAGRTQSSTPQQEDRTYADVPQETCHHPLDDTYEQIPGESGQNVLKSIDCHGNTYETLEDFQPKHSKSTWGKRNIKWRKFLPEHKKK